MTNDIMTIYFASNGNIVIRWPKGKWPDKETVKQVTILIERYKQANEHKTE